MCEEQGDVPYVPIAVRVHPLLRGCGARYERGVCHRTHAQGIWAQLGQCLLLTTRGRSLGHHPLRVGVSLHRGHGQEQEDHHALPSRQPPRQRVQGRCAGLRLQPRGALHL